MTFARVAALLVLSCFPGRAERVFITNTTGSVDVKVVKGQSVNIVKKPNGRALLPDDVVTKRSAGAIEIACNPRDGVQVDLTISIPLGLPMKIETNKGHIAIEGMAGSLDLITESGDIRLALPWQATRLWIQATPGEPASFTPPEGFKFSVRSGGGKGGVGNKEPRTWTASDRLPERRVTYGFARVHASHPGKIELVDIPIPSDSPLKMPWQAVSVLDEMLRPADRTKKGAPTPAGAEVLANSDGSAVFRSDVRVVALSVSVTADGHPVPGLKPEDFEVMEDGVAQQVRIAANEEAPFNLAMLLDLSGSTQNERGAMQEAVKQFHKIARPEDQIATYALAETFFMVLSPLTKDRTRLERTLQAIPSMSGASPVYDSIVLSYAEELRGRPTERNALIVISDGIDNQLAGEIAPSEVSFAKLQRAAEGWNALVYPIFLDPFDKVPPPRWAVKAKKQMTALADATGGKLFVAHGLTDLEPVYPRVTEELRSVYSVTYYPKNQNFDGSWRGLKVKVKKSGAVVRTRSGYFAR